MREVNGSLKNTDFGSQGSLLNLVQLSNRCSRRCEWRRPGSKQLFNNHKNTSINREKAQADSIGYATGSYRPKWRRWSNFWLEDTELLCVVVEGEVSHREGARIWLLAKGSEALIELTINRYFAVFFWLSQFSYWLTAGTEPFSIRSNTLK